MNIRFGVELETKVPRTCGLAVGGYHVGYPVRTRHCDQRTAARRAHLQRCDVAG